MLRKIIVRRNPKLAAWLLALALAPCGAQACSISIQITLDFQKHSAELDRTQISSHGGTVEPAAASLSNAGSSTRPQSFSVSLLRGCHFMRRRSITPTRPSSTSAKAVSTTMPANTVFTSKVPSACRMR